MDLTGTIAPKSDQRNADDFLTGPRTFTITAEIEYASTEQPFGLVLDGDTAHPYKPCKNMRRVLIAAWEGETSAYVGRRLTLFNDPTVRFGGQETGGIRISHMSHITKTLKLNLTETKGKKRPFVVAPLVDAAPVKAPNNSANNSEPTAETVAACTDQAELRALWHASSAERRAQIQARVAELNAAPAPPAEPFWGDPDADGAA